MTQPLNQITILSGKGGTGKTTFTALFAQLSAPNSLLADCDVDAPNLHLLMNPTNISSDRFFSGKIAVKNDELCEECGACVDVCRFDAISPDFTINPFNCEGCGACAWVCPAKAITMETQALGTIHEAETRFGPLIHARLDTGAENSGKLVSEVIQKGHSMAKELDKELVIVDGSPGIGCPVIASLTNATLVIVVVEPTITAIHDMKRTLELIHHFNLKAGVIVNKSTINVKKTEEIKEFCRKESVPLIGEFPYRLEVYKAMIHGKTIMEQNISDSDFAGMWEKIQNLLPSIENNVNSIS